MDFFAMEPSLFTMNQCFGLFTAPFTTQSMDTVPASLSTVASVLAFSDASFDFSDLLPQALSENIAINAMRRIGKNFFIFFIFPLQSNSLKDSQLTFINII